jgi:hypothetical protein
MKGYYTHGAYMGWIDGQYKQFETIEEYVAMFRERSKNG